MMELELKNLTKTFRDMTAVDHMTYTMTNGVYGLLGVNGAGKTTLMRMLCTLLAPTEGEILWKGQDIYAMGDDYRRLLGYLPQDFGYYPDFTVHDYLMYIASIKGLRPAAARKRAQQLLGQVGLLKVKNKKMKKLSGGMKRRAGIAQAMLNDPEILILDEPTAGLDPNERIRFRNLLSELAKERLVLLSTHIVSDVEYIAGRILLMEEGKIRASGTAQELISGMAERVWCVSVRQSETSRFMKKYKVSNMKLTPNGVELRILSGQCPAEGARQEKAGLEDLFLYYFGERSGEDDDGL